MDINIIHRYTLEGLWRTKDCPFSWSRHNCLVGSSKEGRERLGCTLQELSVLVKSRSRQTLSKGISDVLRTCAFDEVHRSISYHVSRKTLVLFLITYPRELKTFSANEAIQHVRLKLRHYCQWLAAQQAVVNVSWYIDVLRVFAACRSFPYGLLEPNCVEPFRFKICVHVLVTMDYRRAAARPSRRCSCCQPRDFQEEDWWRTGRWSLRQDYQLARKLVRYRFCAAPNHLRYHSQMIWSYTKVSGERHHEASYSKTWRRREINIIQIIDKIYALLLLKTTYNHAALNRYASPVFADRLIL